MLQTIQDFLATYLQMALDFLNGATFWLQIGIIAGLALFAIIGVFVFIKKFIKVFIVLAIIGGVGYFLYSQGYLDGLLSGILGTGLITFVFPAL